MGFDDLAFLSYGPCLTTTFPKITVEVFMVLGLL